MTKVNIFQLTKQIAQSDVTAGWQLATMSENLLLFSKQRNERSINLDLTAALGKPLVRRVPRTHTVEPTMGKFERGESKQLPVEK